MTFGDIPRLQYLRHAKLIGPIARASATETTAPAHSVVAVPASRCPCPVLGAGLPAVRPALVRNRASAEASEEGACP